MEIDILENILGTKSMDLVFITLLMATVMRDHGMKAVNKAMACILFAMVTQDAENGIVAASRPLFPHIRMQYLEQFRYCIRHLLVQYTLPRNGSITSCLLTPVSHIFWFLNCRVLEKLLRMPFTYAGWMNRWTRPCWPQIEQPPLLELLQSKLSRTGWMVNFVIQMCRNLAFLQSVNFTNFMYLEEVNPFSKSLSEVDRVCLRLSLITL